MYQAAFVQIFSAYPAVCLGGFVGVMSSGVLFSSALSYDNPQKGEATFVS
jgi:hypothetical protein